MEPTTANSLLSSFWHTQLDLIHAPNMDFKNYSLPLARIKKVMKTDDDVKNMVGRPLSQQWLLTFVDDKC